MEAVGQWEIKICNIFDWVSKQLIQNFHVLVTFLGRIVEAISDRSMISFEDTDQGWDVAKVYVR